MHKFLTHSARFVVISTTVTVCPYTVLYKHNLSTRKVVLSHKSKMSSVYQHI